MKFLKKLYCPNIAPIIKSNIWYSGKTIIIRIGQYTHVEIVACLSPINSKIGLDIQAEVEPVIPNTKKIISN